tara:strand:+ start:64 stop:459 length:396 start_codon:yes stop_codon:yes gene_type:complete
MKWLSFFTLICFTLIANQLISQENKYGGFKLILKDSLKQSIKLKTIKLIIDNEVELVLEINNNKIPYLTSETGYHSIEIITNQFKTVLVNDVQIMNHKLSLINILMKEKASKSDTSIVRYKYQKPKKTMCY